MDHWNGAWRRTRNGQHHRMENVIKTTVFIKEMNEFGTINEVYKEYFTSEFPARSCVQVAALPKGAKVEIEALVIDTLVYEERMKNQSCSGCGNKQNNCEGCQ